MKFQERILIDKPVTRVFKFLSNVRSHKKFSPTIKETKLISDGSLQEGSEVFVRSFFLGRKIESNNKVTSYVPEKRIVFTSVDAPFPSEISYSLESKGEGTEVTMVYELTPGRYFNLPEMFLKPRLGEVVNSSLSNLKQTLEG
ncbi:SRPBCC family protein [Pontibacter sp. G13]|uniref:SRPBCC family protein n=1 Tax=Pontibacter sp. G13 TaxID=3074898 RepID=UPI00288AA85D|nr:SRPBCC family protein [Pontibacter sp. G13]WNJ16203.1 SRPBCC family protein [Pontibacter sp. G13]